MVILQIEESYEYNPAVYNRMKIIGLTPAVFLDGQKRLAEQVKPCVDKSFGQNRDLHLVRSRDRLFYIVFEAPPNV